MAEALCRSAKFTGKQPLAVTTERIAYAAIRANRMLSQLQRSTGHAVDRSGEEGSVCEGYPDATLRQFGLWPKGLAQNVSYKDKNVAEVRERIVEGLLERTPWLSFEDTDKEMLNRSDDCLDALVCALVARARETGQTTLPHDRASASAEGWIHLPEDAQVLERLIDWPARTSALARHLSKKHGSLGRQAVINQPLLPVRGGSALKRSEAR